MAENPSSPSSERERARAVRETVATLRKHEKRPFVSRSRRRRRIAFVILILLGAGFATALAVD